MLGWRRGDTGAEHVGDGHVVTWCHDLDTITRPVHHIDIAPILGSRDDFLEVGDNYVERWVRVDGGQFRRAVCEYRASIGNTGALADDTAPDARVVLVDDTAIAVWSSPAPGGVLYRDRDRWMARMHIGSAFVGDLRPIVDALGGDRTLPDEWEVMPT